MCNSSEGGDVFPGVQRPTTLNSWGPGSIHLSNGRNEHLGVFTESHEFNTFDNPGHTPSIFVPDKKGTVMDQGSRPEPVKLPRGSQVSSDVPKTGYPREMFSAVNAAQTSSAKVRPEEILPQPNMGDLVCPVISVRESSGNNRVSEAIFTNSKPRKHLTTNSSEELESDGEYKANYSHKQEFPFRVSIKSPQIGETCKQDVVTDGHSKNVDCKERTIPYSRPSPVREAMYPQSDLPPLEPTTYSEEEDSTWEVYYEKMKDPQGEYHFIKRYRYKDEFLQTQNKPGMQNKMHQDIYDGDDDSKLQDEHQKDQDDRVSLLGRLKMVWSIMEDKLPEKIR